MCCTELNSWKLMLFMAFNNVCNWQLCYWHLEIGIWNSQFASFGLLHRHCAHALLIWIHLSLYPFSCLKDWYSSWFNRVSSHPVLQSCLPIFSDVSLHVWTLFRSSWGLWSKMRKVRGSFDWVFKVFKCPMYNLGLEYESFSRIEVKYKLLGCYDNVSSETPLTSVEAWLYKMFWYLLWADFGRDQHTSVDSRDELTLTKTDAIRSKLLLHLSLWCWLNEASAKLISASTEFMTCYLLFFSSILPLAIYKESQFSVFGGRRLPFC